MTISSPARARSSSSESFAFASATLIWLVINASVQLVIWLRKQGWSIGVTNAFGCAIARLSARCHRATSNGRKPEEFDDRAVELADPERAQGAYRAGRARARLQGQIGRASCRERV